MADTPKVYVICDANCKWEGMTKEQILTAITQAVSTGEITDINTGFVQTIKTINGKGLKFFVGEQNEYDALSEEDKKDLFAIITNDNSKNGIINAINTLQNEFAELKARVDTVTAGGASVAYAAQAGRASSAEVADRATCDENGNNIVETYAFDSRVTGVITGLKSGKIIPAKATSADNATRTQYTINLKINNTLSKKHKGSVIYWSNGVKQIKNFEIGSGASPTYTLSNIDAGSILAIGGTYMGYNQDYDFPGIRRYEGAWNSVIGTEFNIDGYTQSSHMCFTVAGGGYAYIRLSDLA